MYGNEMQYAYDNIALKASRYATKLQYKPQANGSWLSLT